MQVKVLPEGQKIGAVSTAEVKQITLLPPLSQGFQLGTEYRPVPEVIPPRGYLIKYISHHPIPFFPFPSRGRGNGYLGEALPLFDSPYQCLSFVRKEEKVFKEGASPPLILPTKTEFLFVAISLNLLN